MYLAIILDNMNKCCRKIFLCLLSILVVACGKEEEQPSSRPLSGSPDAWLLCEGVWNGNNASLSALCTSAGEISNEWFLSNNQRRLGDTGQDLIIYGSRLYVTVFASSTIEVIDYATGRSIQQIDLGNASPRYMACGGGKVYVSCYEPHSVVCLDTTTLTIDATCRLDGLRPEGICRVGDSLYVCRAFDQRSNGEFVYDSTLAVIDITSFTQVATIAVGPNPNRCIAIGDSLVAVDCWGDYDGTSSSVTLVRTSDHAVQHLVLCATDMALHDGYLYTLAYDYYGRQRTQLQRTNIATLTTSVLLDDELSSLQQPYSLNINPHSGDIYIGDAQQFRAAGDLYCFDPTGALLWCVETGMAPTRMAFLP